MSVAIEQETKPTTEARLGCQYIDVCDKCGRGDTSRCSGDAKYLIIRLRWDSVLESGYWAPSIVDQRCADHMRPLIAEENETVWVKS